MVMVARETLTVHDGRVGPPVSSVDPARIYLRPIGWLRTRFFRVQSNPYTDELDEAGKICPGQNLDLALFEMGKGKVAGRAAVHIGDEGNTFAQIHRFDGCGDFIAPLFDIVVGPNANGLHVGLGSHDMLHRRQQFDCQAAMRDNDDTDHVPYEFGMARKITAFGSEKRAGRRRNQACDKGAPAKGDCGGGDFGRGSGLEWVCAKVATLPAIPTAGG